MIPVRIRTNPTIILRYNTKVDVVPIIFSLKKLDCLEQTWIKVVREKMLICKLARTTSVILVDLELDCIGTVSLLSCASFHDLLSSFHFVNFCIDILWSWPKWDILSSARSLCADLQSAESRDDREIRHWCEKVLLEFWSVWPNSTEVILLPGKFGRGLSYQKLLPIYS